MFFYFKLKIKVLYYKWNIYKYKINYPYNWWNSSTSYANVFAVDSNGYLNNWNVNNINPGLRPISFLNSHTKLRQSIVELGYKIFL